MITANNGILIVVLCFAFGVYKNDTVLLAAAFAMAGVAYLSNLASDLGFKAGVPLAWLTIAIGVAAYVRLAIHFLRG